MLAARGLRLWRPRFANGPLRAGGQLLKAIRQLIESVNDTLKGQLDLERHGGRTIEGVTIRVWVAPAGLTAAIWHHHVTGQPVLRSLIAYDHYC